MPMAAMAKEVVMQAVELAAQRVHCVACGRLVMRRGDCEGKSQVEVKCKCGRTMGVVLIPTGFFIEDRRLGQGRVTTEAQRHGEGQ